jgi:hypothetical protein
MKHFIFTCLLGTIQKMMWKNCKFGFVPQHRSFSLRGRRRRMGLCVLPLIPYLRARTEKLRLE